MVDTRRDRHYGITVANRICRIMRSSKAQAPNGEMWACPANPQTAQTNSCPRNHDLRAPRLGVVVKTSSQPLRPATEALRPIRDKFAVVEASRGKGGHQMARIGDRWTTVQTGELKPGIFHAMLKQLGIPKYEF